MDWPNISNTMINFIVISIPEEIFVIYFSLLILGRREFIKLTAGNLPRFIACLIPAALVPNLLRTLLPQVTDYLMPIGIVFIFLLIVSIYKITDKKEILRAFVGASLGIIAIMLAQLTYIPLLMLGTGLSIDDVNNSPGLLFIWTLPERTMEFSILVLFTVRKSMATRVNILSILSKNKLVASITLSLLTFNVAFLAIMGKLIFFDNILRGASLLNTILLISLVIMFPIMNISLIFIVIYSIFYRYSIRLLLSKEKIKTLINALAIYTEEKNYSKINSLVTDLHNRVDFL